MHAHNIDQMVEKPFKRKRFLLAQRAWADGYPPVLHQAELLSEVGDVVLLDSVTEYDPKWILTSQAKRIRVSRPKTRGHKSGKFDSLRWLHQFSKELRHQLASGMDVVIAYDPEAASLALLPNNRSSECRRIVHLHELLTDEPYAGLSRRIATQYLLKRLRLADLVIVPDSARATYIQTVASLKQLPLVVMNCPRRLAKVPDSLLVPFLRERNIRTDKIVHFQGAISSTKSLEKVICSMPFWPAGSCFVIVGAAPSDYIGRLEELAHHVGVSNRVVFVGHVPYDKVLSFGVGARVGVTLLNPAYPNWKFAAGASNKRFEYIALGIPQVTNDGEGIRELFERTGVAALADHNDIRDIGLKISSYLENQALWLQASETARSLHLSKYNYEYQLAPLFDWLHESFYYRWDSSARIVNV